MSTLPRFRLPDESSSRDVNAVAAASASAAWEDFDDLDDLETRIQHKDPEFDVMPTRVRPGLGKQLIARAPLKAVNVDDVVEELRAAAAGRKPRVRELASTELVPCSEPDGSMVEESADSSGAVIEVDASELLVDRAVPARPMWNVRQVARPQLVPASGGPWAPSISGPTKAPTSRFVMTAALAMLVGALLAISAAFLVWRLSGLSL